MKWKWKVNNEPLFSQGGQTTRKIERFHSQEEEKEWEIRADTLFFNPGRTKEEIRSIGLLLAGKSSKQHSVSEAKLRKTFLSHGGHTGHLISVGLAASLQSGFVFCFFLRDLCTGQGVSTVCWGKTTGIWNFLRDFTSEGRACNCERHTSFKAGCSHVHGRLGLATVFHEEKKFLSPLQSYRKYATWTSRLAAVSRTHTNTAETESAMPQMLPPILTWA